MDLHPAPLRRGKCSSPAGYLAAVELFSDAQLAVLRAQAVAAAVAGARELLRHLDARTEALLIRAKPDGSPVSAADFASHRAILASLAPTGIPVISEEGDLPPYAERRAWPVFWLVDPLDGTAAFLEHRSGFAVNIALCTPHAPLLGVVADPLTGSIYSGAAGAGVTLHDLSHPDAPPSPIAPPPPQRPYRLLISRSESAPLDALLPPHLTGERIDVSRVSGALKFCLLATGEAELHSRTGPYMEWDCAAGDGILRAIGLTVYSRTTGTPLHYNSPDLRVHGLWVSRV